MSGQWSCLASAPSLHQVSLHTIHLCHKQLPPGLPACALGTWASQHTPVADWDLTFLMTAFNTTLWISFPEKVSGSEAVIRAKHMQKEGKPSRCNHSSEQERTLVEKYLPFFPWCLTICAWETNICFWTWTGKSSGQNKDEKRLCPPLKLNLFFAGSKKQGKAFMLYLFGCYVHFIGKLFAHSCFWSRIIEINQKKVHFQYFCPGSIH